MYKQTKTNKQTDRKTDRKTDKQTNKQTMQTYNANKQTKTKQSIINPWFVTMIYF